MRRNLPLPIQGLSDNEAAGEQPLGTTGEAVNVVALDPVTGRRRLSQRAGSSKYVSEQVISGGKVDEVVAVAYDAPRLKYTQLTSGFTSEWSVTPEGGGTALDTGTDRQGNIFVLTTNGTVTKYNSAGERVDSFAVPVPVQASAVPRLVVDEVDHVIVAATREAGSSRGHIWKFKLIERPDGKSVYQQAWEIETDAGIESFAVRGGALAVLGSGSTGDETYSVSYYAGTFGTFPLLIWSRSAPTPSNAIAISSEGNVLVTSEPSDDRALGSVSDDWDTRNVEWTPHEEYEATTRLHSWIDASQIVGLVHGDRVSKVEDRRFIATDAQNLDSPSNHLESGQPGGTDPNNANAHEQPTDYLADRYLETPEGPVAPNNSRPLRAPKYSIGVTSPWASIEFDNTEQAENDSGSSYTGNTIQGRTTVVSTLGYKSDTDGDGQRDSDGTNAFSNSFLPEWGPYNQGQTSEPPYGNGFTLCQAYILPSSTQPQCVWATEAGPSSLIRYAIVYNATYSSGTGWNPSDGALTFYCEDDSGTGTVVQSVSATEGQWQLIGDTAGDTAGNARRFVVLSFVHGGLDETTGGTAYDNHTTFRINGRHMGRMTLHAMARETLVTNFGGHRSNNYVDAIADMFDSDSFAGGTIANFGGHYFEAVVMLHQDATGENTGPTLISFDTGWGSVQPYRSSDTLPPAAQGDNSGTLDVTTYAGTEANKVSYTKSATTVERLEGYLCHARGSSDVLPDTSGAADAETLYPAHPFGGTRVPYGEANGYDGYATNVDAALNSTQAVLAKFSGSSGEAIWALNGSGIGYGLALDDVDNPMTVGPLEDGETAVARRVIDQGTSYSTGAVDGAWEASGTEQVFRSPKLLSDSYGDLYWPRIGSSDVNDILKLDKEDGSTIWTYSFPAASQRARALAFPPLPLPAYGDDTITGPQFMYGACSGGTSDSALLYKVRLVSSELNVSGGRSLRRNAVVAIGQGDVKVIADGAVSTPTGGSGILNADSPYVQAVQLFGLVFFTDGEGYWVYDPKKGTVVDFVPTDGGELPAHARIFTAWRGRLLATRAADDPYELYASELGEPYHWDIYPAALSVTQAFRGRAAGVGRAPDIVNAFIPMTDDVALIGGDHSIHRLTGDPVAGGDVDVVTDQVGIAYGNSWTKDPFGRVFFFTSRGGVGVIDPSGSYDRVSVDRIERRLQAVDLREYQMRLAWDYRREGLVVWPVPMTIGGVKHNGWFFEAKTGAWWEVDWGTTDVQPSCVTIFDGDEPDDRKVIFGCEDGYVRYIDESAVSDDGVAIDSRIRIGPLVPPGQGMEFIFSRPQIVLASEQDGCEVELLSSNRADQPGVWWAKRRVESGRSAFLPERTRGAAVWARLRNNRAAERFSVEELSVEISPAGAAVPR
jgi:hypothetical protein